ncbi:hypothetical protein COW64_25385 [bacterium (Candidatus Blackallbacteria) CG18_big_fil_WC_8_21_14_2_50_49_26]|nr:MAG: hypothetical protein COW64_25385 [bacterium (Candidatus Blackallbacteria) CG18_big_fil_WC_8_21_14_2_50_49_26]
MLNSQFPSPYLLASLLTGYPASDLEEEVKTLLPLLKQENSSESMALWQALQTLDSAFLLQLQSDYIDLFDRGHAQNPIYETEFGRNRSISKASELADLAGFYRAFGLNSEGIPEMPDHISVELEFYAFLLLKETALIESGESEGVEIVKEARALFLKEHLAGFALALPLSEGVVAHPIYRHVFNWCSKLVKDACELEGVQPDALNYFHQEQEPEEMNCSVLGGCTAQLATGRSEQLLQIERG